MYKLSHDWLLVDVRESQCGATTDICPQCNQPKTFPHMDLRQPRATWRYQFMTQLHGYLEDTYTAADRRCIIVQGI